MRSSELALVGRSLRACLANEPDVAAGLLAAHPELHGMFARAAHHHRVAGYAWAAMGGAGVVDAQIQEELRDAVTFSVARHLRTLSDLAAVGRALDEADADWLVFKGPVLAEGLHGDPARRSYTDLDVLVRPRHLGRALESLEAVGGAVIDRNWMLLLRELRGELHVTGPHGTPVDLHWDLINQPHERRAFHIDADELLDRRVDVDVAGQTVPTLDPDDTLLHLALHTMLSGADRLIWYKDLALAMEASGLRWERVRERARASRTSLVLACAAEQTRRLIGTPVPPEVSDDASRIWLAVSRRAFELPPPEASTGRGSVARLVARGTRGTLRASLAELARRTFGWLHPARRTGRLDRSDPGSMHFESGDAATRDAFVTAVAGHSGGAQPTTRP